MLTAQTLHETLVRATLDQAAAGGCNKCVPNVCSDHFTPGIEEAGWSAVAERMDRWAASGYSGDWQDAEYDDPEAAS
ncbi:hypothetical protein ACWT_5688 [Actinoplanes sp. SE50]|uniref:hypothetical protein n=1 Tax=unclassified Actinoplanes TaxID=2626549 RepID=UPI00023ED2D7|nr:MULTISPECIES: hypothetical protein [unclassified Actinoplanes]AEV86705.1 hypothetical protein ACPL_5818 [Actinoplanes sp. SE50/110]ATO85103.1 hypothetical protein ACWT_5688 [Actinoplanes sp. SE50]SLM02514.1 hypothetical protein ACSP50_5764 [Actinoplanes sp. SE50/110]